jgi:hypothetical protein
MKKLIVYGECRAAPANKNQFLKTKIDEYAHYNNQIINKQSITL